MINLHDARNWEGNTLCGVVEKSLDRLHLSASEHLISKNIDGELDGDLADIAALAVMLFPAMLDSVTYYAEVKVTDILNRVAHYAARAGTVLDKVDLEFRVTVHGECKAVFSAVYDI
jgi:hypothetical protein